MKLKQSAIDALENQNRKSVEKELFETIINKSTSEEYIKQFDIIKKDRESVDKGRHSNISDKAATAAFSTRKVSNDFWREYFDKQNLPTDHHSVKQDALDKSDLETWWLRSPLWRRFIGFFLAIILIIFLAQLAAVIFLFNSPVIDETEDPYLCKTKNCRYMSDWFKSNMDPSVSPCDDFYHFVCGNHINDYDDGLFSDQGEWQLYTAPIEFGRQNVLAEILKNVKKNNKIHNQPITFYQSCLDIKQRDRFGLEGYRNLATELFGDLNEIDISNTETATLEDMAVKVAKIVGDFGLFEFQYDGYPTILITTTTFRSWVLDMVTVKDNVNSLITLLFPELTNAATISEGVYQILQISAQLYTQSRSATEALCATKDQRPFDLNKAVRLYSEEEKEGEVLTFVNEEDSLYFDALMNCWGSTEIKKSSFAFFWLLRIFIFALHEINSSDFESVQPYLQNTIVFNSVKAIRNQSLEYQCFLSLNQNLGYIPIHRYVEKLGLDRTVVNEELETWFRRNSINLAKTWNNITAFPHIDSFFREEGTKILSFTDPVYFFSNIPTPNDLKIEDISDLQLTKDHFQNVIKGKMFTLRQAIAWWTKSHDRRHVLLWNSNTFNLENSYYTISPTDKVNAIFLPISFFLEPYDSDILAIRNGGSTVVVMRKILDYLSEYLGEANVKKKFGMELSVKKKYDSSKKPCHIYDYDKTTMRSDTTEITHTELYDQNWGLFANVLAIKTAHVDSVDRDLIEKTLYNQLPPKLRKWEISKQLIGFEKYTEEQLFFMAIVRHFCRQKSFNKAYENYVTNILSAFMQLDEFATAWKCPPGARMNPFKKCF